MREATDQRTKKLSTSQSVSKTNAKREEEEEERERERDEVVPDHRSELPTIVE